MSGKILSTRLKLIKQPVEIKYDLTIYQGTRGIPSNDIDWPFKIDHSHFSRATAEVIGIPIGSKVVITSNKPFTVVNGTKYNQSYTDTGWINKSSYEMVAAYPLIALMFKNNDNSNIDYNEVTATMSIKR